MSISIMGCQASAKSHRLSMLADLACPLQLAGTQVQDGWVGAWPDGFNVFLSHMLYETAKPSITLGITVDSL